MYIAHLMSFLLQLTDTHILAPGELLYGAIDTARHLKETITAITQMRPEPDAVIITGDLVDHGDMTGYRHFIELIKPLEMPVFVIPGNHDDPQVMRAAFAGTPYFPESDETFQFAVEDLPFRLLALNSCAYGTELPEYDEARLSWLRNQLEISNKPAVIALHHPPMTTGIELIDMGGSEWFQGIRSLLTEYDQAKLVICGHCHTDLSGRIGNVPVYMAPATSHQLIASRGLKIAPSTIIKPGIPTLHHFIDGQFLSGSNAWPANVDAERIDVKSGLSWEVLKQNMMGSRA